MTARPRGARRPPGAQALAHADAETERAFLSTMNEVAEGRTIILIAHRLVGVEKLDRIYRLSGGKAVAAAG